METETDRDGQRQGRYDGDRNRLSEIETETDRDGQRQR